MSDKVDATVDFPEYQIWYRTCGDIHRKDVVPVLLLHGGPGVVSDYLFPAQDMLAALDIPSVVFDQAGNGRSTHFQDKAGDISFWTIPFFQKQVAQMIQHLELDRYVLWGHSWGGMLALEFTLDGAPGLDKLILHSTPASMETWMAEANRLRTNLPQEVQDMLARHEEAGTTSSKEYEDGTMLYYSMYLCRLDPPPEVMAATFEWIEKDNTAIMTMQGPSEFHVVGTLKGWSVRDRLGRIAHPSLVIHGEHDEATDTVVAELASGLQNATTATIKGGSHMAHLEQPAAFQDAITAFLKPA